MTGTGRGGNLNDERSRRRRESILDAAFHVFSRSGYRDAAVDEIADKAATSKGGVYFHFPTKESIFVELMRTTADKLVERVERAVALETDPILQADAALKAVISMFAGHRTMAKLLLIDALGAGPVFRQEIEGLHVRFAQLIQQHLDQAVASRIIPPIDTTLASQAWFGALNEIVVRWLVAEHPARLEERYPALRRLLLRSVGVADQRIDEIAAR